MQPLQLDDIAALDLTVTEERGGRPMELAIDDIDEDPAQPRSEFFAETLQELADSIAARGVLQPVSVRRHHNQSGRWLLNFGARRLRAAKMAGKQTIAAFEDEGADSYDQVIENEQRERLKPLDLALFIQRRHALGESQADIARRMSKSRNYVMVASALIDAPAWLLAVYREGRCRSMNALHELRRLHAEQPVHVEAWMAHQGSVSREMLHELRATLADAGSGGNGDGGDAGAHKTPHKAAQPQASREPSAPLSMPGLMATAANGRDTGPMSVAVERADSLTDQRQASVPIAVPRLRLQAVFDGAPVWVLTDRAPDEPDAVFVQPVGKASVTPVAAALLTLIGVRAN